MPGQMFSCEFCKIFKKSYFVEHLRAAASARFEEVLIQNDIRKITYHPNFSNLKDTMSFLHLLLTPDQEHQQVFHKVPIIGFRRAKSLKDILVRAKVPPVLKNEGSCGPCKKLRCEICEHIVSTDNFKSTAAQGNPFGNMSWKLFSQMD